MKNSWPRLETSVSLRFTAKHSLIQMGFSKLHEHEYFIRAGWLKEINPDFGATSSMVQMEKHLRDVIELIADKNMNEILPVTPTAEWVACWVLAKLPLYFDFVEISAYGGLNCRIDRCYMTKEWFEKLRA